MIRNRQKQPSLEGVKPDLPSIPSPRRRPPIPRPPMHPASDILLPTPSPKHPQPGTALQFNSPRKKYLPEQQKPSQNQPCEVSIAEQLRREELQEGRLAKILMLERHNLQEQREFLMREEQKMQRENEQLRQRIMALTNNIKQGHSPPPLPPPPALSTNRLDAYLPRPDPDTPQKGLSSANETRSSDYFRFE